MFGKDSDGVNVKLSGLFNSQTSRDGELKRDLDKISNKLEQLEMAIEGKGYKIPTKQSVPEPPKKEDKPKQLVVDVPKKGVSFKMASHSREDKIKKDSYWIQNIKEEFEADGLGEGEDKKLRVSFVTLAEVFNNVKNGSSFIMSKSSSKNLSNENNHWCFCCLQDKT